MIARIICVGKLKESYWRDAMGEYMKRLSRFGKYDIVELPDEPEPQSDLPALEEQVKNTEGQKILAQIKPTDIVIALAIDGKQYDSSDLAAKLSEISARGRVCFVIGGSLGLSKEVLSRADHKLSFSKMTFPHQLARVILAEQLFRCAKISAGQRYHK